MLNVLRLKQLHLKDEVKSLDDSTTFQNLEMEKMKREMEAIKKVRVE